MSNILRRFGLEWRRGSEPGSLLWRPELSKQTQRYSFFFSHDWETSRWMKYLSLVIYFSRAAATATCVTSLALGVLGAWTRDMPDGWILPRTAWWTVLGHVVGIMFLLFWQHLREIFWGARFGFLDRLCIPQDDPEKKSQCVYALASFLNKSDDLIVLWSPRYCRRLWCMPFDPVSLVVRERSSRCFPVAVAGVAVVNSAITVTVEEA